MQSPRSLPLLSPTNDGIDTRSGSAGVSHLQPDDFISALVTRRSVFSFSLSLSLLVSYPSSAAHHYHHHHVSSL